MHWKYDTEKAMLTVCVITILNYMILKVLKVLGSIWGTFHKKVY